MTPNTALDVINDSLFVGLGDTSKRLTMEFTKNIDSNAMYVLHYALHDAIDQRSETFYIEVEQQLREAIRMSL